MGAGLLKICSVKAGLAKLHMVKKANQLKNWIRPNFFMVDGIFPILFPISARKLFFLARSFSKASMSSGGYSEVLNTVYRILNIKTNAPMAKAILTDIGTTPEGAASLTPSLEIIQGRLLATQVPIPMINVWTTNPYERWESGNLSATKARKGSMEILMDASKIHKNPAAIHKVGE